MAYDCFHRNHGLYGQNSRSNQNASILPYCIIIRYIVAFVFFFLSTFVMSARLERIRKHSLVMAFKLNLVQTITTTKY